MSSTGRTRLQILAAALLGLGGAQAILYAGFLPLPPFSDVPVPQAARAPHLSPLEVLLSLALDGVVDAIVLWVLLRRWPARA